MSSPLKLTPFEEYMLADDCPDYPMTGVFRLRFSGKLEYEAMNAAVQQTVERHPLVRSTVFLDRSLGYCWNVLDPSTIRLECWTADAGSEYPVASYIDLTKTVGTRFWLVERAGSSDIVAQVHHACADALGLCLIIEDVLTIYAKIVGEIGDDIPLRPVDNERLPFRNHFGLTWRKVLPLIPKQICGLHVIAKFFIRKAATLGDVKRDPQAIGPVVFPSPITLDLDETTTSRILTTAKRKGVTVNDLLGRDLFLAIDTWRTRNGVPDSGEWLRLFVPINHRVPEDATLSAANIMSAVFIERQSSQLRDADALLKSLQTQMQYVKRNQLGFLFIATQALLSYVPRLRLRIIRQKKSVSSCVLSNIGIILSKVPLPQVDGRISVGDARLDAVDFVAPLRPFTTAAFCVCTYAGRLFINLHFDPRAISNSHAQQLLAILSDTIQETVRK